jgi:hypothetical protein
MFLVIMKTDSKIIIITFEKIVFVFITWMRKIYT